MNVTGNSPRCPNHQVPLIRTNDPGVGICPISNCRFEYDADAESKAKKLKINAFGKVEEVTDWKVTGSEEAK